MKGRHRVRRTDLPHLPLFFARTAVGVALIAVGVADAQTVPNSGELLQQTPRPTMPAPSSSTGLTLQQPALGELTSSATFQVQRIEISGNTALQTAELRSLVEPSEGKTLNLSYLEELAERITQRYRDHGYLLSRAYIPAQTISDGVVRIAVLEARYGEISLSNTSKVADNVLKSFLAPLQPGQLVTEGALERGLLLLSDLPGAIVNSTLSPGAALGSSDLHVSAMPGAPYSGSVVLDDSGNRYTGRARLSGTINIHDPLRHGDLLSVNGLTAGSDLFYARLGYQTFVNGSGTTVGAALSGLYYHLGQGLSHLQAHGTAQVDTLTLMQPVIRSTGGNLFAQIAFDRKQLHDEIDASDIHTDRHTNALSITLAGDRRNVNGLSNMSIGLSVGHLDFENDAAAITDAAAAKVRGSYGKFTLSLARLQALSQSNSVYLAFNAQVANKNLDSSEQFFLGGPNSVRAYDVGSVGGMQGGLASAELRHTLGVSLPGTWQATAFVDSGVVRVYKNTFESSENRATLSGVGAGLNWAGRNAWTATAGVATPIGAHPSLVGDSASSRVWVEVRKAFNAGPMSR